MKNLTQYILELLKSEDTILDLGAGNGRQAELFARTGAKVFGVDRKPRPKGLPISVQWHQDEIEHFLENSNKTFDIIFVRNVLQFFLPETVQSTVIPELKKRINQGGRIAIRTFYKDPIPAFNKPSESLFHCEQMLKWFNRWNVELVNACIKDGRDLQGEQRTFFLSDLIVKK